jgi:hypothetical protein
MNEQLLLLQLKVSGIFYNPIINLKDQAKAVLALIANKKEYSAERIKLEAAIEELEVLEDLPHGDLERVKGFNKTKTRVLRQIKELLQKIA